LTVGFAAGVVVAGGGLLALARPGTSARNQPGAFEAGMARGLRRVATARKDREARNPVAPSAEVLGRARAHFADHCASCHGNDGRGKTTLGQGFSPAAPDMTLPATQSLSDGELFFAIKNGIRLTGMPAWGGDTREEDEETWALVHFIRHLPQITEGEVLEMKDLNPRSRKEYEEEEETRRFLEGSGDAPASPSASKH
jgi:mono/diheme cytochrome c family protein